MPQTPEASLPTGPAKPEFKPKASDELIKMSQEKEPVSGLPKTFIEGVNMPVTITPQEADEFRRDPQSSPYVAVEKRRFELIEGEAESALIVNEGVTSEYSKYRETMYQPEIGRLARELKSLETELAAQQETINDLKQQKQELLDELGQESQDEERWAERSGTHYNLHLVEKELDTGHIACSLLDGKRPAIQHQLDQVNRLQSRYSQPKAA